MSDTSDRSVILTVDTNERNQELLGRFLADEGYRTRRATTAAQVDAVLDQDGADVALVDVSGFGPEIWDRCRALAEAGIPHLVISPRNRPTVEREGMAHGARAVMLKPLVARRLMSVIEGLLGEPSGA